MNVPTAVLCVILMPFAIILKVHLNAYVMKDTQEMEALVKVIVT